MITPIVNRPGNIWNIIGFAGCLLLSYDPLYIKDLGFILSFSAVISIIYFYGLFEKLLPESINPKYIQNAFIKYTLSLFLVSLSAQIGTLPITAAYFHKIPIISLIANVMIWGNASKPVTNILFMDVGQGAAALIKFSNGKTMPVDAGNRNRREEEWLFLY